MSSRNKVFLNEMPPPKETFGLRFAWEMFEITEGGPLAGTNIGKQFGLKKQEPHEPIRIHSTDAARRRVRMRMQSLMHRRRR